MQLVTMRSLVALAVVAMVVLGPAAAAPSADPVAEANPAAAPEPCCGRGFVAGVSNCRINLRAILTISCESGMQSLTCTIRFIDYLRKFPNNIDIKAAKHAND